MMPDLGKYATAVLTSYAVSLTLILALIAVSVWRSRKVKAELKEIESRRTTDGQN